MTIHQLNLFEGEVEPPRKESALQRALVKMLRTLLREDVLMRHITAGGADARTGAKLKQLGRLAGCADLEFMWKDGRLLRVLFLELKMPGRTPSETQLMFRDRVTPLGPYCVVTTIDEALAALMAFGLLKT
ncbi:MAG TPA: hypothetical protein VGH47_07350 [Xanthobacteraceae bacterium]|jgi:hypothetical protein